MAKRYGINPEVVAKWKSRSSVYDLPTEPKQIRSTELPLDERVGRAHEPDA